MALKSLQKTLEKIDQQRDELLFPLLKKYWPEKITPNFLSSLKIVLGLLIVLCLIFDWLTKIYLLFIYATGLILDILDGSVARALNKKTKVGAIIDPIGDKLVQIPMVIFLLWGRYQLLLGSIIIPEMISALGGFRRVIISQPLKNNIFGKTKMWFQAGGLMSLIVFPSAIFFALLILWLSVFLHLIDLTGKWLNKC